MSSPRTATLPAGCRRSSLPMAASCVTRSLAEMRQRLGSIRGRKVGSHENTFHRRLGRRAGVPDHCGGSRSAQRPRRVHSRGHPQDAESSWTGSHARSLRSVGWTDRQQARSGAADDAGRRGAVQGAETYGDASRNANLGASNDPFITCDPSGFLAICSPMPSAVADASFSDPRRIHAHHVRAAASGVRSGWTDERCQKPWM